MRFSSQPKTSIIASGQSATTIVRRGEQGARGLFCAARHWAVIARLLLCLLASAALSDETRLSISGNDP